MNTQATTATVTPFTQNLKQQPQKQQTAKEVIAANVQALIEQLEQGHSEGLTAYLLAMGKFHNYSFGNILEIARQKPDATRVAGMYAWNQLGRRVKKGEKGIRILAPMIGIRRKKDAEAEKDIRTQNQPVLVGFRSAYVFDASQTDGAELPELSERVKGNVGEYRERLIDLVIAQGIELDWKESISPALGVSYGGKIVLVPGQETAEEFSTLVHELAHLCCVENYVVSRARPQER
jgi:antirestriction protein ArdC